MNVDVWMMIHEESWGLPHRNIIVRPRPLEIEVSCVNHRGYQLSRFREDREEDL